MHNYCISASQSCYGCPLTCTSSDTRGQATGMNISISRIEAYRIVITGVIGIGWLLVARHADTSAPDSSFGRMTRKQVLSQTDPLCSMLAPNVRDKWLSADPISQSHSVLSPTRHWQVDCTDTAGRDLVHLTWNADTRKIISITTADIAVCRIHPITTKENAVREAKGWMVSTGVMAYAPKWRCTDTTLSSHIWEVTMRSLEHTSHVYVDTRTGALRSLQVYPYYGTQLPVKTPIKWKY